MQWFGLEMHFGQTMETLISWWPIFQVALSTIGWTVIVVQLGKFITKRSTSYSNLVQSNILRFKQMQSANEERQIEAAVRTATCTKCGQFIDNSSTDEDEKFGQIVEARNHLPQFGQTQTPIVGSNDNNQTEKNIAFNVSRTKSIVSKLTRKFENGGISPKFNQHKFKPTHLPKNYFFNERSNDIPANQTAKPMPLIISKPIHNSINMDPSDESSSRSSSPEVRYRRTSSNNKRTTVSSQRSSMDNILERDEWGNSSEGDGEVFLERSRSASDVRTVEDILQQERFSKCFSEYSISDLLNDFPSDVEDTTEDEVDLTLFLNRIE